MPDVVQFAIFVSGSEFILRESIVPGMKSAFGYMLNRVVQGSEAGISWVGVPSRAVATSFTSVGFPEPDPCHQHQAFVVPFIFVVPVDDILMPDALRITMDHAITDEVNTFWTRHGLRDGESWDELWHRWWDAEILKVAHGVWT